MSAFIYKLYALILYIVLIITMYYNLQNIYQWEMLDYIFKFYISI